MLYLMTKLPNFRNWQLLCFIKRLPSLVSTQYKHAFSKTLKMIIREINWDSLVFDVINVIKQKNVGFGNDVSKGTDDNK